MSIFDVESRLSLNVGSRLIIGDKCIPLFMTNGKKMKSQMLLIKGDCGKKKYPKYEAPKKIIVPVMIQMPMMDYGGGYGSGGYGGYGGGGMDMGGYGGGGYGGDSVGMGGGSEYGSGMSSGYGSGGGGSSYGMGGGY